MIVDELITLLKFDVDGMSNAEAFDTVLSSIEERSKEIVLGLTGVIASVGFFADRVSKAVAENYEWAKSNGVAADSYQRFEHAAAIVGGSLDDMKGDLEGWVRSAKASGQTLEEVFLRETDSIKGMTTEQSHALLKARGYSDTSIKLIQQGEGKLKEFLAQAQVIPEENLKAAEDYAKTWREVSSQVTQLMTSAVASALPALKGVLETIRAFVERNKELVKSTVAAFFKSVAIAVKILFMALSPLIRGIELLLKIFDLATFGIGKYIIIIGALTAAFIALGVAATIKAARGIASLMGNISKMVGIAGKAIGYLAEMTLNIAANGVKQTFLNSQLAIGVKLWWLEFKARMANLGAQLKNLAYATKELLANTIGNTMLANRIGLWWLDTKARIANMLAGAKATITTWAQIAAQKAQILVTTLQTTTLGGLIAAIGTYIASVFSAIAAGIKWAITMTAKMIPAMAAGIASAASFAATLASSLIATLSAAIPALIGFASTFFAAIIPAFVAATAATWAWTAALLANPVTWIVLAVVAAVAALGAAIYAIIKYWDDIVAAVKSCFDWVVNLFGWMKNGESTMAKIMKWLVMFVAPLSAIYFYWDEIVAAIDWCWQKIKAFFSWWWSSTVKFWSGVWNKITGFASKIWGIFVGAITKLWNYIKGIATKLWNFLPAGVQNFLKGVYSKVTGMVKNIWNKITSVFSKIGSFFAKPFKDIWKSATGVIDKVWNSIKGFCSKVSETVKQAFLKPINFILGLLTSAINFAIDGINVIIRGLNKLPGVDIPEIDHVDLRIKDKKEEDKKEEEREQPATLSQQEQPTTAPTVQEPIVEQSTMSQEQPKQQLARQTSLPPVEEKDSQYWQRKYDSLVALRDQRPSEDRSARMKEEGVGQDSAAAWNAILASVAANKTQALQREMYAPQSSSGVRLYDPRVQQSTGSQEPGQSGVDRLARILDSAAPANSVAVPTAGVATATPGQVTNNNQRSASYVDQRNITINTNATSGPAIANHLRGTNDMMSSGIGMAGAY